MAPLAPMVGSVEFGIHRDLAERRRDAAEQVEHDEAAVADAVLDVVAEDPQVPHVADDVRPAAVQEHRRHERRQMKVRRHDAVPDDEQLEVARLERQLEHPRERVQDDDGDGDERERSRRDDVAKRDHVC